VYNYFTHAFNDLLSRQLMNIITQIIVIDNYIIVHK